MGKRDQGRRAVATDSQWNNQVTTAASDSAKENTSDSSLSYAAQQRAANTEDTTDSPDTPGLTPPAPVDLPTRLRGESSVEITRGRYIGPERAALIVQIKQKNPAATHQEIADAIGCSRPVVTEWLSMLELNTVPEARKLARSQALRATLKLSEHLEHDDARVQQGAASKLVALAGVQETQQQVAVGVQVVVGQLGQPAGMDPFSGHNVMVNCDPVSD